VCGSLLQPSSLSRMHACAAGQRVDFRKGHDGLAALVKNELRKEPFTGTVFVFRAKRADRLKLLYWDGTGLAPLGDVRIACRAADGLQTLGRNDLHLACNPGRLDASTRTGALDPRRHADRSHGGACLGQQICRSSAPVSSGPDLQPPRHRSGPIHPCGMGWQSGL